MPKTDVLKELRARIAWHRKFEPAPVSILVDAAAEIERLRALNADLLAALETLIPVAEAGEDRANPGQFDATLERASALIAEAKGGMLC